MIHVCSLARLHDTVDETGARHIVTLLRLTDRVERPAHIAADNHLILGMDDISSPMDGMTCPADEHVARLIDFVGHGTARRRWWCIATPASAARPRAPSSPPARSIPRATRLQIARDIRRLSRTAQPNARIVSIADRLLDRNGRMVRAVETIGPGDAAMEGHPFRLDLA